MTRRGDGPRALSPAERAYVLRRDREGRRILLVFGAATLGVAAFVNWEVWDTVLAPPGGPSHGTYAALAAANLLLLGLTGALVFGGLRRPDLARRPGARRVGRHRGVYFLAGKPLTHRVGKVPVLLPSGWVGSTTFQPMHYVEVEVTPAFEDVPNPRLTRVVLAAVGEDGRRLAIDPAAPWRLPARAPGAADDRA